MYSNAGIRSHSDTNINTLPNNRHVPTTSDPPHATNNPLSSLSSLSIVGGHVPHRSEDGILSASAVLLRSAPLQANRSAAGTTTTVLVPPSSFHAHSKTSTSVSSFSRNPSHASSSSTSYNINHKKAPSVSSTSLFLSRTALLKPVAQSTTSVSRSCSISRRNGSSCSGMAPAEPAAPQRINMKRLMSKPIAILAPDRAQSVMAFAAQPPPSDTDDSRSIEDHLAIKLRSLDILRRSRRRSRSVDLMMNYGVPSSYPLRPPEGPLHRTATSIGLHLASEASLFLAGEEYARDLRSATIPKPSRPAPILLPDYNRAEPRSIDSEDENVNSPGFPLSPASVIALTWTKSQKRANSSSTIAGIGESSSGSTIPQSGFSPLECSDSTSVLSPVVFADANEVSYQIDLSSPPIVTNSPGQIFEDAQQDEYFTPWAVAEQGRNPRSQPVTRDASSPSTKGGYDGRKLGVAATMREVSRRFTGAFGRREKKQEKPAMAWFPINHHAPSLSMGSSPPNLESNSSPPPSFSFNRVSKAPKSHERAGSLTITGAVKNEPLSTNQLLQTLNPPLVVHCQPADPKAITTEFDQLCHTPLTIRIDTSPQASISERDSSLEVTTPRQPPALEMPNWSLLHSSSSRRTTVDENGQELTLSRQISDQPSPISPFVLDRGRIRTPARSNTLKKRSRPSLRAKPSASTFVPVSGIATEGTETTGVHSAHVLSSTPPSLSLNEGTVTGGKLGGLVRKFSSGTLAQSSSQSDRSRSPHTRGSSLEIHGTGTDDVPPVPQIPKDFELILDADAYFAERARLLREGKFDSDGDSTPSSQGNGGPNTALRIPGPSQMSSRHSSLLGDKEQVHADLSSLSSSLKLRLRVDTEHDRAASSSKQPSVPVRRKQPPSVYDAYTFPKRANTTMEHRSSSNSQVDYIGSSSASQSYLHRVNMLYSAGVTEFASGSFEEKKSLSSHSHEMVSSYPNSILAQPIMPPKDLYQHGEDEAAALRRQQSKDTSTNHLVRRRRSGGALPAGRSVGGNQEQSPAKPPPPTLPPSLLPLTAPPPRPPRRVTRVQSSTVLDDSTQRPTHRHQRSLSSPTSPTIPNFLTTKIANSPPPPDRSRSVGNTPRSPQPLTSTGALPSSATAQGKRARSDSVSKKAKHLPHLVVRPRGSESASNVSPGPASGERNPGENGSQPKVRVKTSLGTITRTKSVLTPKSASSPKSALHTPSSSASYTHSPQSSGPRSCLSRTSRDHSFGHGWVTVDDGEAPPVPFTSTAFTFKEISPVTGPSPAKGKALTEGEREDLWNALLSRSDRVGGTLTITLDKTEGPALLSDNVSFRDD